ncbi:MAG TPA: hypothetical protein VG269_18735 [Tepidisphaeraceae bacterium]|nr:hypothetical protein [Tepidisphaeraceae bacterium]
MNSPGIGIGLYFWLRFRWVVGAMLAYLFALAAAAHIPAIHRSPDQALVVVGLAVMVLIVPFLYLVNGFTYGPTDLAARTSGFPKHMLSFPASARALVGWPMLYGGVTVAVFWMAVCVVLSACGPRVPLFWPALECWAVLAWIQAVAWVPFPVPVGRAVVLIPILLALVGGGVFCAMMDVPPGVISVGNSAMILLAYAVAVGGAARFRRGDGDGSGFAALFGPSESSTSQSPAEFGRRTKGPFRSPAAAQLWHECRRNIAFLPVMTAVTCIAMFVPLVRAAREHPVPRISLGAFDVAVPVFGLAACLVSLYSISGMAGAGLGKADYWGKLSQWPAFLTTRPYSSGEFVLAKLKAAAISSALSCAILILFTLLGSILVPSPFDRGQSLAMCGHRRVPSPGISPGHPPRVPVAALRLRGRQSLDRDCAVSVAPQRPHDADANDGDSGSPLAGDRDRHVGNRSRLSAHVSSAGPRGAAIPPRNASARRAADAAMESASVVLVPSPRVRGRGSKRRSKAPTEGMTGL